MSELVSALTSVFLEHDHGATNICHISFFLGGTIQPLVDVFQPTWRNKKLVQVENLPQNRGDDI